MIIAMRYGVALVVAALIIGAVWFFIWQTKRDLVAVIRQQQAAANVPPEPANADPEAIASGQFNLRVPANFQVRLDLSRLLSGYWYAWTPVVLALCLGVAAIVGRLRRG
jgi:hypothetical protein